MICRPPFVKPLIVLTKRIIEVIQPLAQCGVWYRRFLKRLEIILCLLDCEGETVGEETDVGDEMTTLRGVDLLAIKTYITNIGDTKVKIFEDGHLMQVLWPNKTWESPVSGRLVIEAIAAEPGAVVRVAIATHRRCDCDLPQPQYGDVDEPIGGHLI